MTQRIRFGKQALCHCRPNDCNAARREFIGVGEVRTRSNRGIGDLEVRRPGAHDLRRVTQVIDRARDCRTLLRCRSSYIGRGNRIIERGCVIDCELLHRWVDDLTATVGVFRCNRQQIATERLDARGHGVGCPLTESDQDDHGGYADHDA